MKVKRIGSYSPSDFSQSSILDPSGISPTVLGNHGTVNAVVEREREHRNKEQHEKGIP